MDIRISVDRVGCSTNLVYSRVYVPDCYSFVFLKETQAKCAELEDAIQKTQTLLERSKATNEHIVKQWKYAVKEKKKLQRDISNIVMSRDEAIQRNLSTLSQLDRVKDERDRLARRARNADQNGNYSESSDAQCNLADCQFCTESSFSPQGVGDCVQLW